MRKLSVKLMAVSLLSLLSIGVYGYGKDLKEHITIPENVMVGSSTLKHGNYLVKYDAATSQVSFKDLNKNKVVTTAMATIKVNDKKAPSDAVYTKTTPEGEMLVGLRLGGQREELAFSEPANLTEPIVILPSIDIAPNTDAEPCGDCDEVLPTCEWVSVPMGDDGIIGDEYDVVISDEGSTIPEVQVASSKLVCQP